MRPVADNVLIAPAQGNLQSDSAMGAAYEYEEVEGSVLVKPGSANKVQSTATEGIIRAIGAEVTIAIAEGDRVLFRGWTGIEARIGGEPHVLTPQKNVLAVVEQDERLD